MQTLTKRLSPRAASSVPAILSLKSLYPLQDRHVGGEHPRFIWTTTLTPKGIGHLVRKGTGGRSFVRIQPAYVVDVAAAVVAALKDDSFSMGKVYELGGPDIFTVHELADLMFETIREWPRYVKVPFPIARAIATPREMLVNKLLFPLPSPEMINLDEIN